MSMSIMGEHFSPTRVAVEKRNNLREKDDNCEINVFEDVKIWGRIERKYE